MTGGSTFKETVVASFLQVVNSGLISTDTLVSYSHSDKQSYAPGSKAYIISEENLQIKFDNSPGKYLDLTAIKTKEDHYSEINPVDYWNKDINAVSLSHIPYRVSKSGDTLYARLDAMNLRGLLSDKFISQYRNASSTRTFTNLQSQKILSIPDSAYLKVTIIGSFPLAVKSIISNVEPSIIVMDHVSKLIRIFYIQQNQNISLPCYDLLGRKHNLEFLGTDGTASMYSVRPLRAGVYFVSDGKEMVKFMIGE